MVSRTIANEFRVWSKSICERFARTKTEECLFLALKVLTTRFQSQLLRLLTRRQNRIFHRPEDSCTERGVTPDFRLKTGRIRHACHDCSVGRTSRKSSCANIYPHINRRDDALCSFTLGGANSSFSLSVRVAPPRNINLPRARN